MPFRCVAFNCSNVPTKTNNNGKDNVCLHKWPTDKSQADAWRRFVCSKRKDWKPSSVSRLCSKHFTEDCFENMLQFSTGHSKMLRLRPGAIPTVNILPRPNIPTSSAVTSAGTCTVTTSLSSSPSQQGSAAQCTLTASTSITSMTTLLNTNSSTSSAVVSTSTSCGTLTSSTTMRSAVRKREIHRVNTIVFCDHHHVKYKFVLQLFKQVSYNMLSHLLYMIVHSRFSRKALVPLQKYKSPLPTAPLFQQFLNHVMQSQCNYARPHGQLKSKRPFVQNVPLMPQKVNKLSKN